MSEILSKDIPTYERDGLDFLYELEKPANNLFFANFFGNTGENYEDVKFRIAGFKVESPSLNIEYTANKQPSMKSAEIPHELTITWVEDAYRSVEKFHTRWMQGWYDFRSDFLPIGANGRFKNIEIIGYHYKNVVENSSAVPLASTEPVIWIRIYGALPTKIGPGYQFAWGDPGSATIDISYQFSDIVPYYYNRPYKNSEYLVDGVNKDLISNPANPHLGGSRYQEEEFDTVNAPEGYEDKGGFGHWYSNGKMPFSAWAWKSKPNSNAEGTDQNNNNIQESDSSESNGKTAYNVKDINDKLLNNVTKSGES